MKPELLPDMSCVTAVNMSPTAFTGEASGGAISTKAEVDDLALSASQGGLGSFSCHFWLRAFSTASSIFDERAPIMSETSLFTPS